MLLAILGIVDCNTHHDADIDQSDSAQPLKERFGSNSRFRQVFIFPMNAFWTARTVPARRKTLPDIRQSRSANAPSRALWRCYIDNEPSFCFF